MSKRSAHVEKSVPEKQERENLDSDTNEGTVHIGTNQKRHGCSPVYIDPKAEAKLRLKIDLYIVPTVSILYLFCFIDRANIGNAKIAGFGDDLSLQGYDYNLILSCFYISYVLLEIPANILCKWMGPGWFLPASTILFGIASLCTAFVDTVPQACGVRFVLGIFEAGLMPGIAYYLSRWYTRAELAFRLALYIVMAPMAGAFGGLLASGILSLDHFGNLTRWRMIFAIEGIITIGLGIIAFFTLTDRPNTARWLTEEEKEMALSRIKAERIGQTEVLDKMDKTKLKRGMFSPVTMTTSWVFLLNNICVQGMAFFAPSIVRAIYPGRTTVQQQLLTVPPYIVGAFFTILFPFLSWKFDRRLVFFILSAPLIMTGYTMFLGSTVANVRYGAIFLIASSAFALGPLTTAHVSANVVSDTARSAAIGMNVMIGNLGGVVSTWSYLDSDSPDYHIGNGLNLAAAGVILISSCLMFLWIKWQNKKRECLSVEEELAGMSESEVQDLDWKHPAFRWRT